MCLLPLPSCQDHARAKTVHYFTTEYHGCGDINMYAILIHQVGEELGHLVPSQPLPK